VINISGLVSFKCAFADLGNRGRLLALVLWDLREGEKLGIEGGINITFSRVDILPDFRVRKTFSIQLLLNLTLAEAQCLLKGRYQCYGVVKLCVHDNSIGDKSGESTITSAFPSSHSITTLVV
jgi:hypothetical protein